MNTGYSKPEVEKPKLTKTGQRTMLHLEARSHANVLEELATTFRAMFASADKIPGAMEKGARLLRELTK